MRFTVTTAGTFYNSERDKEEIGNLKKLGFSFKDNAFMDKDLRIAGDDISIELSSLEELIEFIKTYGDVVVDNGSITIYNDYLE